MIAVSLARVISAHYLGSRSQIWSTFWVQAETSVSVMAVSMTAFRTLFVIKAGPKRTPPEHNHRSPSRQRLWRKNDKIELPEVDTGATMTGMRTMIRENGRTEMASFAAVELPLSPVHQQSGRQRV